MKLFSIHLPLFHKLRDKDKSERFFALLKNSRLSFALEAGVPSIGREIKFFVSAPVRAKRMITTFVHDIWPDSEVKEEYDYNLFHSGGSHAAAYLTLSNSSKWDSPDNNFLNCLNNFLNINPIGESIGIQIVSRSSKGGSHINVNIRAASSAGTEFRAKELLGNLTKILSGLRPVRINSPKFLAQFVNQEFEEKQSIKLTVGQLTNFFHF